MIFCLSVCLSVCYSCILILYVVYDFNNNNNNAQFLARDSMQSTLYVVSHLSVRLLHVWIGENGLISCPISLQFLQDRFHPEILTRSPERRHQTRVW